MEEKISEMTLSENQLHRIVEDVKSVIYAGFTQHIPASWPTTEEIVERIKDIPYGSLNERMNGIDAFPCYTGNDTAERGMTLRDYFAGQALVVIAPFIQFDPTYQRHEVIAHQAYLVADAMLKERLMEEQMLKEEKVHDE